MIQCERKSLLAEPSNWGKVATERNRKEAEAALEKVYLL